MTDPRRIKRAQAWLTCAGCAILIAGSAASVLAYRSASHDRDDAADVIPRIQDSKLDQYQLEKLGGKANVASAEIGQWFAGLWHGRQLAYTLAVLTIAVVLTIFLIADFLPHFPPFPPAHDDRNNDPLEKKAPPK